jgi:hypothetical protein
MDFVNLLVLEIFVELIILSSSFKQNDDDFICMNIKIKKFKICNNISYNLFIKKILSVLKFKEDIISTK